MTDYEIAKKAKVLPIVEIAKKLGLTEEDIEIYGKDKAKINHKKTLSKKNSKLILVTSTSPTPFGEGKTTLSVGIVDSLNAISKKAVAVLREPSLGPVFGTKGGATGGGRSQVIPMDDINLHFTGDIHAVTSANNLLCAIIDNHLFQGNSLQIDPDTISFERCLDVNDRALRSIHLNKIDRNDSFNISVASEIMAILCLASDIEDLKNRISAILIGYSTSGKEILVRDLHAEGAITVLLKDAINPNLVQTIENNPVIIHGGPFANIAHGCNSVIATKMALSLSDYVVTESGFGSDMGALKFLDIKCRMHGMNPDLIVLNTTVKSLVYNGEGDLTKGIENLGFHIENMLSMKDNILVVLNQFEQDTEKEIVYIQEYCKTYNVPFAISLCYKKGSDGGHALASTIVELTNKTRSPLKFIYDLKEPIIEKVNKICKNQFHADSVIISAKALEKLDKIKNTIYEKMPICIAKTPVSITDDSKLLGFPKNFTMTVTDIKINAGAGFITIYMGNIITMPGLSKQANYLNMDVVDNAITGLF